MLHYLALSRGCSIKKGNAHAFVQFAFRYLFAYSHSQPLQLPTITVRQVHHRDCAVVSQAIHERG